MIEVYEQWIADGEPTDANGSVDHEVKMYYLWDALQQTEAKIFIESGTSHGDAIAAMRPYANWVYSIEAHDESFAYAKQRFEDDEAVKILFGDSAKILPEVLYNIDQEAVFWLDAHYSGDGTALLSKQTPIVEELKAIAAVPHDRFYIIIDDARGFGVWDDYPPMEEMKTLCEGLFKNHEFWIEADEIFIYPKIR